MEQLSQHGSHWDCLFEPPELLHPACVCVLSFREEWEWLQKMAGMEEPVSVESENETSPIHLFQELQVAIKELMALVNIPLQEVRVGAEVQGHGR